MAHMGKIKIEKVIWQLHKQEPFTWKDIKFVDFEDDDVISLTYDEGHYSENNSWDPFFDGTVTRSVLETDEEQAEREQKIERDRAEMKERRYQTYLKLKKEFEKQ